MKNAIVKRSNIKDFPYVVNIFINGVLSHGKYCKSILGVKCILVNENIENYTCFI